MAKHITTWQPDTCECVIHYEWDDAVPVEERTHTPLKEVVTREGKVIPRYVCPAHQGSIEAEGKQAEHFQKIREENSRKNIVMGHILESNTTLAVSVEKEDGTTVKEFRKGMEPTWSFDANRNLKVSIKEGLIGKAGKSLLKTNIESQFEKVILE